VPEWSDRSAGLGAKPGWPATCVYMPWGAMQSIRLLQPALFPPREFVAGCKANHCAGPGRYTHLGLASRTGFPWGYRRSRPVPGLCAIQGTAAVNRWSPADMALTTVGRL